MIAASCSTSPPSRSTETRRSPFTLPPICNKHSDPGNRLSQQTRVREQCNWEPRNNKSVTKSSENNKTNDYFPDHNRDRNLSRKIKKRDKHSSDSRNRETKRARAVEGLCEWIIPSGTKDKHRFVSRLIQQGNDPCVSDGKREKPSKFPFTSYLHLTQKVEYDFTRKRKRCRRNSGNSAFGGSKETKILNPVVTSTEFDNRFLSYKHLRCGIIERETLVMSFSMSSIPISNSSQAKLAWENNHVQEIPDEPPRPITSSRVGPQYQAQISPKLEQFAGLTAAKRSFLDCDSLWDPKLAEEAKERGEDISGFLDGDHELRKQELLFSILHKSGYCVKLARLNYEKILSCDHVPTSSSLNSQEAEQFEVLTQENQKDFSKIAKSLNRTTSDCLVHYYQWKVSSRSYHTMKKYWKVKYCSVCNDGGELIVCDQCNAYFHLACATPRMSVVPAGHWFCRDCRFRNPTVLSRKQPMRAGLSTER